MTESTMTAREIAEVAGISTTTIRRTGTKLFPELQVKGRATRYNHNQSMKILSNVRKSNFVQPVQNEQLPVQNEHVDYELIGNMIGTAISAALAPIAERLSGIPAKQEPLKIEAPKITPRANIRKVINEYVAKTGANHRDAYISLYKEYGYRVGGNVTLCAKNRGIKVIDYIEEIGQLEVLEAIALDYFKESN